MTLRYFEYHGGGSHKFWEIDYKDGACSYAVRFGRCGTNGQTQQKHFPNYYDAKRGYIRIVAEKMGKGYVEMRTSIGNGAGTTAPAPIQATVKLGTPVPAFSPQAPKLLPMLATEIDVNDVGRYAADDSYIFEPKLDGHRVMINVENGTATAIGRNGQLSQHAPRFKAGQYLKDITRLGKRSLVLDGELMGDVLWVFDMPRFVGGGSALTFDTTEAWRIRHKALELVFAAWQPDPKCFRLVPHAATEEDKLQLVIDQKNNSGEGVVIKLTSSPYYCGQRRDCQLKAKFLNEADLIVTKVNIDGKDNAALSVFKGASLVEVGKCSLIGKPKVAVGDVVVVRFLYVGAGDRIVQPRLMSVRTDKAVTECTWSQLEGARTNKEAVK